MKVFKLTVMIVDHDGLDNDLDVVDALENGRFANRCISPNVMAIESREIGEWDDDNPLNYPGAQRQHNEFERLFAEPEKS
jgi:hypothetical protein